MDLLSKTLIHSSRVISLLSKLLAALLFYVVQYRLCDVGDATWRSGSDFIVWDIFPKSINFWVCFFIPIFTSFFLNFFNYFFLPLVAN